ncbi:SRPBCC family protein [Flindersiella endophytica]
MSEQQKPFEVETVVDAPVDVVWRSFTSLELIHQWFGWDYDELEGEIRFIFADSADPQPAEHRIVFGDGQRIELVPDGPRTVVKVTMPGDLSDASWDDIYDGMEEGWRTFFEQLRFYLERRTGSGGRRTIYLTGVGTGEAAADALLSGEPWHDSRYQRMSVDAGGMLLGIAGQQPMAATGPISLTVTSYGLDDAAFAELEKHWADRWSAATVS